MSWLRLDLLFAAMIGLALLNLAIAVATDLLRRHSRITDWFLWAFVFWATIGCLLALPSWIAFVSAGR